MPDRSSLAWPFFDPEHQNVVNQAQALITNNADRFRSDGPEDGDQRCRAFVQTFGNRLLKYAVPAPFGGQKEELDIRSICLIREALAYHSGLADFAFAMQGLGSGPISLFGSDEQKRRWLPSVVSGDAIAAFAISERHAGSDVAAMGTTARSDGGGYVIN